MRDSKYVKALVTAFEKGYKVDKNGNVTSPFSNKFRKLNAKDRNGIFYYEFSVRVINNESRNVAVHQLQAFQKFGEEALNEGIHVRHLDGNSLNNSWDNIDIGTQSINMLDRKVEDRLAHSILASTHIRKFTDEIVEEIRFRRGRGATYKELMEAYNISSKGTLWEILNRSYVTIK